jgi:DNA/RNA-binding domain of Phe-tRNA-synthetase-like protein
VPAGAYDLDKLRGDLVVRISPGNETIRTIGSQSDDKSFAGEVVYADNAGITCRCWNYRDADRTKVDEQTTNVIIIFENVLPQIDMNQILTDCLLLVKNLGGEWNTTIIDTNKTEFTF